MRPPRPHPSRGACSAPQAGVMGGGNGSDERSGALQSRYFLMGKEKGEVLEPEVEGRGAGAFDDDR